MAFFDASLKSTATSTDVSSIMASSRSGAHRRCDADERIGMHEVAFGLPYGEDGAAGKTDDAFGDAAHEEVAERAAAVRAHHDQIDLVVVRVVDDREGGRRGRHDRGHGASLRVVVGGELLETAVRRLLD